jgi:hypothetical protein
MRVERWNVDEQVLDLTGDRRCDVDAGFGAQHAAGPADRPRGKGVYLDAWTEPDTSLTWNALLAPS